MADADPTHVDLLMSKYTHGRTIAQIEREANLPRGALAHHLKPSQRGRAPNVDILERFASALDAPVWEVSEAFFADAGVAMEKTGGPLPADARQLLDLFLTLDKPRRRLAIKLVQVLAGEQATT